MKAVCQWKNADKYVTTDKTNDEKRNNISKVWIGNNWWSSGLYKGKRRKNVMPWMNCCVTHIQSHAVKYIAEIKIWHCKHNPGKWHWSNWRLQQTYINKYFKKWTLSMKKNAVATTCNFFRYGMYHMTFSHSIRNSWKRENCLLYQKHNSVKIVYLQLSRVKS